MENCWECKYIKGATSPEILGMFCSLSDYRLIENPWMIPTWCKLRLSALKTRMGKNQLSR